jgi:hypothetical protein
MKYKGLAVAFLLMTVTLSACSGPSVYGSSYFHAAGITMGGNGAILGEVIDFSAPLLSDSPGHITLVSAKLIPLRGLHLPILRHVGVVGGCGLDLPNNTWNWPPRIRVLHGYSPVRKFAGSNVWTGGHGNCINAVIYGVVVRSSGPYATGDLIVTFRTARGLRSSAIYAGGYVWFHPARLSSAEAAFIRRRTGSDYNRAWRALKALANS